MCIYKKDCKKKVLLDITLNKGLIHTCFLNKIKTFKTSVAFLTELE